jgi:hypothetical protein
MQAKVRFAGPDAASLGGSVVGFHTIGTHAPELPREQ